MGIKKLILSVVIAAVAVLLVAILMVKILVSPRKIAAIITPRLEQVFGHPVEIGAVELTIFSGVGVRIHNVIVRNAPPFDHRPLANADAIDAKLQLLSLLTGKFKLKSLTVTRGQIYFIKDSAGVENFSTLSLQQLGHAARAADEKELFCRQIDLRDARLLYRNDSTGSRFVLGAINGALSLGSGSVPKLNGEVRSDSLFFWSSLGNFLIYPSAAEMNLQGVYSLSSDSLSIDHCDWQVDKIKGTFEGSIDAVTGTPDFDLRLISDRTELADCADSRVLAAFPALRQLQLAGDLRIDIGLQGDLQDSSATYLRGKVTVTDAIAKVPGSDVSFQAKLVESDFNEKSASVFTEQAVIGASPALLRLAIDGYSEPTYSGELRFQCAADVIARLVQMESSKQVSGDVSVALSGFVKSTDRESSRLFGDLTLTNFSFHDPTADLMVDSLNSTLSLTGNDADLSRFELLLNGYRLQLAGSLTDFAPYVATNCHPHKRPRFEYAFRSDSLALGVFASGYHGTMDTTAVLKMLDHFFDFDSKGSVIIDSGAVAGLRFANLQANVSVVNRILYSDSLTCELFHSTCWSDVVVDFSDLNAPEFDVEYAGNRIEANDFLSGLSDFTDHLYGRMDVQATFKGQGIARSEVRSTLRIAGTAKISDGKIVDLPAAVALYNTLGIAALPHDEFDNLQAAFRAENSSLTLGAVTIKEGKLVYQIEGAVDFGGGYDVRATRSLNKDEARTLAASPQVALLSSNRSDGRAVLRFSGDADTAIVRLEALLPKD